MSKEIMGIENQVAMFGQLETVAKELIKSGLLPPPLNTPEKVKVVIVTGKELGMPMMEAVQRIQVIQGKPALSPQGMMALIERSGVLENIEINSQKDFCEVTMKRKGRTSYTSRFGKEEAAAMFLISKDNYKKQAQTMYRWRAIAACARVVCPDVIGGMYLAEEVASHTDVEETMGAVEHVAAITDKGEDFDKWREDFFSKMEEELLAMKEPHEVNMWKKSHESEVATLLDVDRDKINGKLEFRFSQLVRGEDKVEIPDKATDLEAFKRLASAHKSVGNLKGWFKEIQAEANKSLSSADFEALIGHLNALCEKMKAKDKRGGKPAQNAKEPLKTPQKGADYAEAESKAAEMVDYWRESKNREELNKRVEQVRPDAKKLPVDIQTWLKEELESIENNLK